MRTKHHIALSIVVSGVLFAVFRSWSMTIASFISGIFIDADHVIDYWIVRGVRFDMKQVVSYFSDTNFAERTKLYFIFHSWELLLVSATIAWLSGWDPWLTGLVAGFSQHMVLDEIYNSKKYRVRPCILGYFFLWRWKNGFQFRSLPGNRTQ